MTGVELLSVGRDPDTAVIGVDKAWETLRDGVDIRQVVTRELDSDVWQELELRKKSRRSESMAAAEIMVHIVPMFGVWPGQTPGDESIRGRIEEMAEVAAHTLRRNTLSTQGPLNTEFAALMRVALRKRDWYESLSDRDKSHLLGAVANLAENLAKKDKRVAYTNGKDERFKFNIFGQEIKDDEPRD